MWMPFCYFWGVFLRNKFHTRWSSSQVKKSTVVCHLYQLRTVFLLCWVVEGFFPYCKTCHSYLIRIKEGMLYCCLPHFSQMPPWKMLFQCLSTKVPSIRRWYDQRSFLVGFLFLFFLKVSEFYPYHLSCQIIRLLKRIIQLCANWSMTFTFTDLQISDTLIFMALQLHFCSLVITSEKSGSAALRAWFHCLYNVCYYCSVTFYFHFIRFVLVQP